jgi:phage terminase large subunit GpA-like protein
MATSSSWLDGTGAALRPPPRLSLSEWADQHYRLSAESSAQPGKWRSRPYQKGILDAITDPAVERVSVMKSARVGYTLCINAAIAYHMHHDPCSIMVVQPTVDGAKKYSKEFIAPMLRDVEVLADRVQGAAVKSSGRTILDKSFPGGVLSMVGANSGAGFRMSSRRVVIFDEVDGYPPSAGDEGDPIALGENRALEFWNRKIIAGSTPTIAGSSRIEELFEAGDRRRFHVPCPHCGHMDHLTPREENDGGHFMRWDKGQPDTACFVCRECGCEIEEKNKRAMLEAGEWRAAGEFSGHASFHIWAAYSMSPNTTWAQIAKEFVAASKAGPEKLRAVINTLFGETWKERGEAPDWQRLYERRETYVIGTVPEGPIVLTAGVDVQKDRFVYEVVGWAANKESWSIDAGELYGDTALESTWLQLDGLLDRAFPSSAGAADHRIAMLAVDARYNTQVAYGWARQHPMSRVIAVVGVTGIARALVGTPSPVDVTIRGKRMQRGYKAWPVGGDIAKSELYGWLGLPRGDDPPAGYCHFPEYGEDFFKQLTSEHLVTVVNRKTNRATRQWQQFPNRENHHLDARVYARAAAAVLGIDRLPAAQRSASSASSPPPAAAAPSPAPAPAAPPRAPAPRSTYLNRPRGAPGRGWLRRRR